MEKCRRPCTIAACFSPVIAKSCSATRAACALDGDGRRDAVARLPAHLPARRTRRERCRPGAAAPAAVSRQLCAAGLAASVSAATTTGSSRVDGLRPTCGTSRASSTPRVSRAPCAPRAPHASSGSSAAASGRRHPTCQCHSRAATADPPTPTAAPNSGGASSGVDARGDARTSSHRGQSWPRCSCGRAHHRRLRTVGPSRARRRIVRRCG